MSASYEGFIWCTLIYLLLAFLFFKQIWSTHICFANFTNKTKHNYTWLRLGNLFQWDYQNTRSIKPWVMPYLTTLCFVLPSTFCYVCYG